MASNDEKLLIKNRCRWTGVHRPVFTIINCSNRTIGTMLANGRRQWFYQILHDPIGPPCQIHVMGSVGSDARDFPSESCVKESVSFRRCSRRKLLDSYRNISDLLGNPTGSFGIRIPDCSTWRGVWKTKDVQVLISMDIGPHLGAVGRRRTLAATCVICWR